MKKLKNEKDNNTHPDEHLKKKKVFLSMLDIKEAQYKK